MLNMHYTYKFDLKIGFLDVHNYYLMQSIVAKPWSKLQNIAQGVFTAMIYRRILLFRQIESCYMKQLQYPILYKIHKSKLIGLLILNLGLFLILFNLLIGWHANNYPKDPSML